MMPVQKILQTYKTAMDFKSQSSAYQYRPDNENKMRKKNNEYNNSDSFQALLNKNLKNKK